MKPTPGTQPVGVSKEARKASAGGADEDKTYWDSSALIAALHEESLRDKLQKESSCTRSHSFAEVFSPLTGGRLGFRYSPDEAADLIASLAEDLEIVELDGKETITALQTARRVGVRGGRVHDYLHAIAAKKAKASRLFTLNERDFVGLIKGMTILPPE